MKLRWLILIAFMGVTLIPVALLGVWPHSKALQNEVDRVSDQHVLLARHLKLAMERYYRDAVSVFDLLVSSALNDQSLEGANRLMKNVNFGHICVANVSNGRVVHSIGLKSAPCPAAIPQKRLALFMSVAKEGQTNITGVFSNPEGNPTIYLLQRRGALVAVGALNTNYLRELGKAVTFGKRGHAAIVDQHGLVIAHPLDDWVATRKDISLVPPVQRMMNGETGISKFYSPALKDDMIAGFTTVAGPGWGVMIPQPFAELEAKASSVQLFALAVIMGGFLVALAVAWFFTGYLIGPIAAMGEAARRLADGDSSARAQLNTKRAPFELHNLLQRFNVMADTIQRNQQELEGRVDERTRELRQSEHELRNAHDELERRIDERTRDLRVSEGRFKDYAEAAADWFWEMDADLRFTYMSKNVERIVGVPPEWHYGKTREELLGTDYDHEAWAEHLKTLQEHKPFRNFEFLRAGNGIEPKWLRSDGVPLFADDGAFIGYRGTESDITERKRIEVSLRSSEARFAAILDLAGEAIISMDDNRRIELFNEGAEAIFGYSAEQIIGQPIDRLLPIRFREAHGRHVDAFAGGAAVTRSMNQRTEITGLRKNGEEFPAVASISKIDLDERMVFTVILHDITERKAIEDRFRQAQKMEAVGQLTGGVAHDFNNHLAVILGNAELLSEGIDSQNPMLQAILRASRRGAELTQRLLAFSRQQPLRPQTIELASLVGEMSVLLASTLGETVEIEIKIEPGLMPTLADPGQVENALLNLAINARDAMPGGGKLTIECTNAELDRDYVTGNPDVVGGSYVMLALSDTGEGMTKEVLERAFEPFFTTKKVGEGTGLGLSMVYGFARQSGGHLTIYSEPGHGTTVKLYLPSANQVSQDSEKAQITAAEPRGRGEAVLIIEDDPDVRQLAVRILGNLGYKVIEAPEALSAMAILEQGETIELVLSDVVLPGGMSGPEFADAALPRYPGLKIIFMSGYPAEAARHNGFLGSDKVLLNKPFEKSQLAIAIRQALDS